MRGRHPSESRLALLAGGECGPLVRFSVNRHVRHCAECEEKLAEFRDIRLALREQAQSEIPNLDWTSLAAEMRANIRLGLAAGECVREVPVEGKSARWRFGVSGLNPALALAVASVVLVVGASVYLVENVRMRTVAPLYPVQNAMPALQSTGQGIEVSTGSGSLVLLPHNGATPDETVHDKGAIRTRYIDGDTGTVTFNNVYLQ